MANDHYETLGVRRDASAEEIQKAYRELARKHHPDMNPGDKSAKQKFQKVQAAFDVLKDPEKRSKYDQFGDAFESVGSGGPGTYWSGQVPPDFDLGDLFGGGRGSGGQAPGGGFTDFFRQFSGGGPAGAAREATPRRRGRDLGHELEIPFNTAVLGGEAQVALARQGGKRETITVKIPAGIEDGKKIRLRGQGQPGVGGESAGDIMIEVRVAAHPCFSRRGKNLDVQVPVTLEEAVVGAKIDVPTPQGTISLSVPPGTSSGAKLRVRGHGVAPAGKTAGDLFAEVMIVLPPEMDADDWIAVKKIQAKHPQNPRGNLRW